MTKSFSDIVWSPLQEVESHPAYEHTGFHPDHVEVIPKGHVRRPGFGAFTVDVILEQDCSVKLRDGITIYTDVYRPVDMVVPAIILWSPYGKGACETGPLNYTRMGPFRFGIPYQSLSGYETFEGLNPADWAERGYAIVDVDARGTHYSEGDIHFWGQQEADDIYDTIEWLSKRAWCNGSVVMAGNSWLAISQLNFAARYKHPALKAIAPWEGLLDLYMDQACRGGRPPEPAFGEAISRSFAGKGSLENAPATLLKRPLYDSYWASKEIEVENITIPTYLTGSYSTSLHSRGSFHAFDRIGTDQKWLRVHATQEWHDLYRREANDDLQRFFDRYAKGLKTGWEQTSPLRLSLIGFHESVVKTIVERPEYDTTFPLSRTKSLKLHLDAADGSLSKRIASQPCALSYEGHSTSAQARFDFHFDRYTELSGMPWVRLWMSCDSHTEMDVVVTIRKINAAGKLLEHANFPVPVIVDELPRLNTAKFLGPSGILRASHRVSQVTKSDPDEVPRYSHRIAEPLQPGGKVPLEIPIWPIGMVFGEGEGIALLVSGHDMTYNDVRPPPDEPIDENKGLHSIHTGMHMDSFVVLPVIS